MIKVLFLSAWYPNRNDAMFGLFVRKHAEAVARFSDVYVLYLHPDDKIKQYEIVEQLTNKVNEIYVYYPFVNIKYLKTFSKAINYFIYFFIGYRFLETKYGKPDITHANILTRTGFLALILKKIYYIPYVLMEHWTRYLPQNFAYTGFIRRKITKIVVKNSGKILPVSENLKNAMIECGLNKGKYLVINNVVDDFFLEPHIPKQRDFKRILHVSCFLDNQKNITGILRVIKRLSSIRNDFELVLIGTGIDFNKIVDYSRLIQLPADMVKFLGEKPPVDVNYWIKECDFTLLFSNYENSPVVIGESLVCGKPVISTNVGGISELINDTNGILVNQGNEDELFDGINILLNNFNNYDSLAIMSDAKKRFSYESIGEKLLSVYSEVIMKTINKSRKS